MMSSFGERARDVRHAALGGEPNVAILAFMLEELEKRIVVLERRAEGSDESVWDPAHPMWDKLAGREDHP